MEHNPLATPQRFEDMEVLQYVNQCFEPDWLNPFSSPGGESELGGAGSGPHDVVPMDLELSVEEGDFFDVDMLMSHFNDGVFLNQNNKRCRPEDAEPQLS
jgi:hypothetical protein